MTITFRRRKSPRVLATSVAALLGFASAVMADSATWFDLGNDWATDANWNGTPFPNAAADIATFGAAVTALTPTITSTTITVGEVSFTAAAPTYTVTLDGAASMTSLTFSGTGVTNGSAGPQNFTATGGGGFTATFTFSNSATAGTNTAWTLNDGAVMQFNDSSTAGGATVTIQSGGKAFFAGSSSGGTAVIVNNAGGAFDISAQAGGVSVGSIAGAGNFLLGGNTLTTGSDNTNTNVSGVIQDGGIGGGSGGGLTKTGTGILTLSGPNAYTGTTTIAGGTIALTGAGALADATAVNLSGATGIFDISGVAAAGETVGSLAGVGGSSVVLGGKNLTAGGNNGSTAFAGVLSGAGGSFTKTGTGTLTLSGVNTYTGATTIAGGTLTLTGAGTLSDTTAVDVTGATAIFNISGITAGSETIGSLAGATGSSVVLGAKNLTTGGSVNTNFGGVLSGPGGSLTKVGTGMMTLTGANTYTGATTVNVGTLAINTATNPTVLSSSSALVLGGGTFQMTGAAGTSSQTLAGLTLNAGASVIDVNNLGVSTTLDLRGAGGTLGITHNPGGSVDFRATSGDFGTFAIVRTAQQNDAFGRLGVWATVNNGAAFAANDGTGKIVAFTGYTDIDARGPDIVPNAPNTDVRITAPGTSGPVVIAAATTNIRTLTQNFTTASVIDTSPGTLRLGTAGGVFITSGKAALTIGTAPNSGILTAGGNAANVAGELTAGNYSGNTLTINSVVADNGTGVVSLTKIGSGLLTLAGTNTYTGATTIGDGTLALTGAGALADTSAVNLTTAASVFDISAITATGETVGSLAGVSNSSVLLGGKNLKVGGNNSSTSFAGVIAGAGGSLTKVGTGALTLSASNTYTGGTRLENGTLILNTNTALSAGTTLTIATAPAGTATLGSNVEGTTIANPISVLGNFSVGTSANNFTFSGPVDLNGGTREITGINTRNQIHFTGPITNGALTLKTTLSATGDYVAFILDDPNVNTYSGLTRIGTGAFLVLLGTTPNGAIQGDVLIEGNGVLDYLGSTAEQVGNTKTVTVNSTGNTLSDGSGGTTQFTGLDLFNASGTETIGRLEGTGTVGLGAATLSVGSGSFSGVISDGFHGIAGGSLLKTGTGVLTLSGANTYTGATGVSDGTLTLTGAGSLSGVTAVSVGATGIFNISGVTAASKTIGSLSATTATASVVLGGKNLTVGGTNTNMDFNGVISGAGGSLTKVGTGTMTLTGLNTYTGATTVNAGTLAINTGTNPTVLSSSSALVLGGGTFQFTGSAGISSQTLAGLTVNAGASVIDVNNLGASTTLDLRGAGGTLGITHNPGGSVDFRSTSGGFGTLAQVLTKQANDASGILGAWATVNNGAAFATKDINDVIVAYTGYTDIDAQGSTILNGPNTNVRITATGAGGPVVIAAATTNINTLTQDWTTTSVIDTSPGTLRFGTTGGIFITPGKAALTIGTVPNSGVVTAGGNAENVAGELILGNFSGNPLTINSVVANNGTGLVGLTKTGGGLVVLTGTNTYTGATTIEAGTLRLTGLGSVADTSAVNLTGGTSVFDISGITAAGETIGSLAGASGSSVTLGAKNLTAGGNNTSTTFAGVISGTGAFTKVGTGAMTLTGANTFSGTTTVNLGTLNLNTTGANALAGNVVVAGGNVVLQQSNQILDSKTVSVSSGSFNIGANNETVAGVQLTGGTIDGTTGVLTSTTAFDFQSGTVNANLAGAVALNKTTAGTVTLNGQNTYSGPTNVNGGVLILDGIINNGTNGVNVNNGSEFDVTVNGIVVVADGVTVVTATTGNTINNAGLLQGGNNSVGVQAASNNKITNSGSIVGGAVGFQGVVMTGTGNNLTNNGFIGGATAVVVKNAGDNAVVNYGTLTGTSGVAIDASANTGRLALTNMGRINGNVLFGTGNDTMTLVTNHAVNGIINGGGGSNTLRLVGTGEDTLDLGSGRVINFNTLRKLGGGTWTLTGEGRFSGGTTVTGGNLFVQGNLISDVLVQELGFLGGTGIITGNLINNGTVNPGNSPGTMTIKGNFDQGSKGTLVIEIAGKRPGQYDVLVVGGKATLDGTLRLVRVDRAPRLKLGEKITFLTAGGGVEGKFKKVSNPFKSDSMIQSEVVYGSNSVALQGVQGSYVDFARLHNLSANQQATAVAVDAAAFGGKNKRMVEHLNERPLDEIPGNLDRIAPEELAAVYRLGVGMAGVQSQNLQRRMDDLRLTNRRVSTSGFQTSGNAPGYSGQFGAAGVAGPDGQNGNIVRPHDDRWGAFLTGMGEWIRIGDTENARGYELNTGGVTVGVDYKVTPNLAVGVSAGYAGTAAELTQGGRLRVNSGKVGAYATYYDGGFYADAAVSGGYNSYETQRSGLGGTARGRTDGGEFNGLVGVGYDWSLDALTLGALTSVEYTYLGLDEFTETGSLAPLSIPGQHGQSLRSKLGLKAVYDWRLGGVLVKPEIRAVWQHEYGDRSFALDSRLASGAGGLFTVRDPEVGRDSLLLGVGGSVLWNARTATYLYYDGELYRKESESHNISGGVRISF